jgi:hypothetical protein
MLGNLGHVLTFYALAILISMIVALVMKGIVVALSWTKAKPTGATRAAAGPLPAPAVSDLPAIAEDLGYGLAILAFMVLALLMKGTLVAFSWIKAKLPVATQAAGGAPPESAVKDLPSTAVLVHGLGMLLFRILALVMKGIPATLSRIKAKPPVATQATAVAPPPEPAVSDIPVIAAAVYAVVGARRIVHIEDAYRGAVWTHEGRSLHQTSHVVARQSKHRSQ